MDSQDLIYSLEAVIEMRDRVIQDLLRVRRAENCIFFVLGAFVSTVVYFLMSIFL